MITVNYRVGNFGARFRRSSCFIPILIFVATSLAVADTNIWTKPSSGYWEEQTNWSLGTLPDATQIVLFTNAGWKALAIGTNASENFPQSMSVQSLRIGAPVDSFNTLLMNFSGFDQPLRAGNMIVESNGAVVMQGSALEINPNGQLLIAGSFKQGDYSLVHVPYWFRLDSGSYYLTNGTLNVGLLMEDWGKFFQYGGTNYSGSLHIDGPGEYHLYDGQVQGFIRVTEHGRFFK
jgi:hypothetical protein